ncbi:MAG: chemotaxis response regulator protein-glutamate methylesterase [Deltaproteobacteria bacterium]|nr:chemotaxis response regulator protein-glutamate methylesterase [Deltaproteobacteria bacterium]
MQKKLKVLIVDDSAVIRRTLAAIISADPHLEVIGTASDPFIAADRIREEIPDVITLDVEMPRMDGITFLHKMMSQHPIPAVIISSLTESGSATALKALEYGAVEIIQKPQQGTKQFLEEAHVIVCDAIKAAAVAKLKKAGTELNNHLIRLVHAEQTFSQAMLQTTDKVIAVGASTGGTEAIRAFLQAMPPDAPGIVIVQHMPEKFTASFAKHLDSICKITVKEAHDHDSVIRGRALIAPGNRHMLLNRSGARYYVEVKDGPLISRHRPSVDLLFRSVAKYAGMNAVGVIMTGMGDDGAKGMLEMKEAGSYNIAQDEESCIVFGMPKEAIKLGAADIVVPLNKIASKVLDKCALPFHAHAAHG